MQPLDFEAPIRAIQDKIEEFRRLQETQKVDYSDILQTLEQRRETLAREIFSNLSPWQRVQLARHPGRPLAGDYIRMLFKDFVELHGDRCFGDDRALLTGFARLERHKVLLIATCKGKNLQERKECNFGMPHPEGYRKALEKMKLAEKFQLPVMVLINTPGAYPGIGAEERGQAMAIARNLLEMSKLKTPIVCAVVGEGFSGGALGIGVGDVLLMQENAVYAVISPEGCAAILWKDGSKAPDAAAVLKLTAHDLYKLGIADEVVPEPLGGAHTDPQKTAEILKGTLVGQLDRLTRLPIDRLLEERYEKYRRIGVYLEGAEESLHTCARS